MKLSKCATKTSGAHLDRQGSRSKVPTFKRIVALSWMCVFIFLSDFTNPATAQEMSSLIQGRPLPGVAKPMRSSKVYPLVDGVISHIFVSEGQQVKQGQLLAVLDQRLAKIALRVAERETERLAELEVARAQEELARTRVESLQAMIQQGAASQQQIDTASMEWLKAKSAVAAIRESIAVAQAKAELANEKLKAHEIRAPFSGTVMRIASREGEKVAPEQGLLELADTERLKLEIYIPVSQLHSFQVGREYPFDSSGLNEQIVFAELQHQEQSIDIVTRTSRCVFVVDNRTHRLPTGTTVELRASAPNSAAREASHTPE